MSTTIDHLSADHRVKVLRDFSDARGRKCRVGETAVIRRMGVDWSRQEISIEWERDGVNEKLVFELMAKSGPRNGAMREYFAVEERVPLFEDTVEGRAQRKFIELQRSVPTVDEQPVREPTRYEEAVARIWALAARRRFDEAERQIRLVLSAPAPAPDRLEQLAEDMAGLAALYRQTPESEVYDWLREHATRLWYAWGSQATSGGEGAVRAERIRAAERRMPERG